MCPIVKFTYLERFIFSANENVLFVATNDGLFYISLDTDHHIPIQIPTGDFLDILDVDYDPVEKKIYFIDSKNKTILRCRIDGSDLEVLCF